MNEQEYEKSIAEPTWRPMTPNEIDRLKAEREFSRGVWAQLRLLREQLARVALQVGAVYSHPSLGPIPDAIPAPKPPKCAIQTGSPYGDHDWRWTGRRHKRREDGDVEYGCVCLNCDRQGLAVQWPGDSAYNADELKGQAIGKAKIVAW